MGSLPTLVVAPAVVLLVGAALLPLLPRRLQAPWFLVLPVVAAVLIAQLPLGSLVEFSFYGYDITPLRVDRLSLPFAYVFVAITVFAGIFGLKVMGTGERVAALAYAGSALGVVFAGDLLTLFFFWEMKVATSVFLIWARRTPASDRAGMRYLFVHLTGGVVLVAGILWHLAETGSLAFVAFEMGGAAALILIGVMLAAAVPPLHAWLADAYPEATVAGMVFLSAYTTKASVYALARGFAGTELLVWFGVAMAIYGVVYAVIEKDIRRLLAYHIISQVGFMVAGVGIGTEAAVNGAVAHAFAHILYKALLVMGAGAVLHTVGTAALTRLGGLFRALPLVFVLYMVGALSISGVPGFSGFVSKEMTISAASAEGRAAVVWLLKFASVGTFLSLALKLPYFTWFDRARGEGPARPVPTSMYVGMGLLAGVNVAIGLAPGLLYDLLPHSVDFEPFTAEKLVEVTSLLALAAFAYWLLKHRLEPKPRINLDVDWLYREMPRRVARLPARLGLPRRVARPAPDLAGAARWATEPRLLRYVASESAADGDPGSYPTWVLGAVVTVTFVIVLGLGLVS